MGNYFLSQIAEQDIDEIIAFIAVDNRMAAMKFLNTLFETLDMLSENAFIGHKRNDLTDKPVRFWPFKLRYLIVYSDSNPIEVVRVLSGYRDISTLLI